MSKFMHPPETYTVDQFCNAHNISRSHLYVLVKKGDGPRLMKVGRRTLITNEAAKEWRESHDEKD